MASAKPTYLDAVRMIDMLKILEETPVRERLVTALADRIGVSTKTIKRYADALHDYVSTDDGEPIVTRLGSGKAMTVRLAHQAEPVSARIFNYAAVWAATRSITAGKGSALGDAAEPALRELKLGLPDGVDDLARRVEECFVYLPFGPKNYRTGVIEEILNVVIPATLYRNRLKLRYRNASGRRFRCMVEPYAIVMYRDGLYVMGKLLNRRGGPEIRLYSVDRILEAERDSKRKFKPPTNFDAQDHLKGSLGLWQTGRKPRRIRIAFDHKVVDAVKERQWPGSPRWVDLPDGRVELRLRVPITPEVVTWIVAWGDMAEVTAPVALRNDVRGVIERALNRYNDAD
jgi:predicted DNA-binding transcriptional regulator YafY